MTNFPGFTPARLIFPNLNCVVDFANYVDYTGQAEPRIRCPRCQVRRALLLSRLICMVWLLCITGLHFREKMDPAQTNFITDMFRLAHLKEGRSITTGRMRMRQSLYNSYEYKLNHGYWGFYAQDRWKLRPNLTFNYGVRWDFETGLGDHIESYYGAIQPRVGLAYSPDSKTVIRAGAGCFLTATT